MFALKVTVLLLFRVVLMPCDDGIFHSALNIEDLIGGYLRFLFSVSILTPQTFIFLSSEWLIYNKIFFFCDVTLIELEIL